LNPNLLAEREFFIDNLLVRIHFIIVMITWTGLAPPQPFECPFPGSLTSTPSQCLLIRYTVLVMAEGHQTPTPRISVYLSIYLSIHPSIHLSIYLYPLNPNPSQCLLIRYTVLVMAEGQQTERAYYEFLESCLRHRSEMVPDKPYTLSPKPNKPYTLNPEPNKPYTLNPEP